MINLVWFGLALFGKPGPNQIEPFLSTFETIPVGLDDGNSDNNSVQLELELCLSLVKKMGVWAKNIIFLQVILLWDMGLDGLKQLYLYDN